MSTGVKEVIRKKMLELRKNMNEEDVKLKSSKIIDTLLKLPSVKNAKNVMVYMSFRNEVNTFELIETLKIQGKKIIAPLCDMKEIKIIPSEVNDIEKDFVKSKLGYLEPNKERLRAVDIDDIDVIVVPGVAFDKKGNRIGFGAGFYDRFLKNKSKKTVTVALAYDYQIIDTIPNDKFDVPLDYIITEKRIIVR